MDKKIERTVLNQFLLVTYIFLVLLIPLAVLSVSLFRYEKFFLIPGLPDKTVASIFLFVSLPVYLIYAFIIKKELFPDSLRGALYLFVPIVISYGSYLFGHGFNDILLFLIISSLPLYLGLNLIFFTGFILLVYRESKYDTAKERFTKIIVLAVIIFLLFSPPVFFFLFGIRINLSDPDVFEFSTRIILFITDILLMAFFHYKILIKMYDRGML